MKLNYWTVLTLCTSYASSAVFARNDCGKTVTITLGGGTKVQTTTTTSTDHSVVTKTVVGLVATETVNTTTTTATTLKCLTSGTTFTPSPLPIKTNGGLLHGRAKPPPYTTKKKSTPPPYKTTTTHTKPCTATVTSTSKAKSIKTITKTTTLVSTSTSTLAAVTTTVTQTYVVASPTAYPGLNYYQYINDYFYLDSSHPGGSATAGYGGGGYETSDWNGNKSYYTNGLTQNLNFQSENYPSYSTIYCQLPGQAQATYCAYWTVVFQGFLHATTAGNYTFQTGVIDNELLIWGGPKAYRRYSNDNCDLVQGQSNPQNKPVTTISYALAENEFYPLTLIYSNGEGPGELALTITAPDGTSYPTDLNYFIPPCPDSPFRP